MKNTFGFHLECVEVYDETGTWNRTLRIGMLLMQ